MGMKYGQEIINGLVIIGVQGYDTLEEARQAVADIARAKRWTSPKWWQFWRIRDTRWGDW